jgi:hypothetical protein
MHCSLIDGANVAEKPAASAFSSEDGGYRFLYNVGRDANVLETSVKLQCWFLEYYIINVFFIQNKTFLLQIAFS